MIRRLVLDVLKPHDPGLVPFVEQLSDLEAVSGATGKLVEIDENVRTIRIALEGEDLDLDEIDAAVADLGGSVHSIDEVSCGDEIVEDPWLTDR